MAQQNQRGTAESTGRGRVVGLAVPVLAGGGQVWSTRSAAASPVMVRNMVAYVAPLPVRQIAISAPTERQAAHRYAETECFAATGNQPCRLLAETTDRCLAVAHAVKPLGLVITSDPRTFTVHHYGSGSAETAVAARTAAVRDCNSRVTPGMTCRAATSRCGA